MTIINMRERVAVLLLAVSCLLVGYTKQPVTGTVIILFALCQDAWPGWRGLLLALWLLKMFPLFWEPAMGSVLGVSMYWCSGEASKAS